MVPPPAPCPDRLVPLRREGRSGSGGAQGSAGTCSPTPAVSPHQLRDPKDNYFVGWTKKTHQTVKVNPPRQLQVRRHGQPCHGYWQLKPAGLALPKVSSDSDIIYCLIRRAFVFWPFFSRGIISTQEKKPKPFPRPSGRGVSPLLRIRRGGTSRRQIGKCQKWKNQS